MPKPVNMIGIRLGKLVVISRAPNLQNGKARWVCKCDCGGETITAGNNLRSRRDHSCGCQKGLKVSKIKTKHGRYGTKEYKAWRGLISRCTLESGDAHGNYKGRGITVCSRWLKSFENFFYDMGMAPTSEHSIERKNNNEGYNKENCKWGTILEQANNKTNTKIVEYRGQKMPFMDAVRLGAVVSAKLARQRINRFGWSVSDALETPIGVGR